MPVDAQHPHFAGAASRWQRCRAAAEGQEAVYAGGVAFLPKLTEQSEDEYKAYQQRALYYNATGRTVDGLSGLIFRRPPTTEIPAAIEFVNDDADAAGTPLVAFCEGAVDELIKVGRVGLLADYPSDVQARTQAEEQASGARPYVKVYKAETIINWRVEKIANRWQLALVVLTEQYEERADDFATACTPQWRVLKMIEGKYVVELWRKPAGAEKPILAEGPFTPMMGGKALDFIPFVICGPMGVGVDVAKPPIQDLADVNLSHYRTTADYEHGLHFTGLPTPIITGHQFNDGEKLALGSTQAKAFPNPEAKAFFMEFEGKGLDALSKRLGEKELMMVTLGARMLATEKKQVEAAETAAIHRAGENSVLASLANAASAALSKAFTWCAQWAKVAEAVRIELNTDYLPSGMTAQDLNALVSAWQTGAISHETLYDNLRRGEIAQQGVDFTEEKTRIETEGPNLGDPAGAA